MTKKTFFTDAESLIKSRGLNLGDFCSMAGIHRTTWFRWKGGQSYISDSMDRVNKALAKIEKRKPVK